VSEPDRFSRDVWWNVAALAVAGGCGILFNYAVSAVYGASALGAFNQVFAVYIILSQFGALGFHYSLLRSVASATTERERKVATTTALLATAVIGGLVAAATWLLAGPIGRLLDSDAVGRGVAHVAPGVFFFSLSKVTLACLNGLERMRWYAILFGGRFVLMLIGFAVCAGLDVDAAQLPIVITLAEAVILLASLVPVAGQIGRVGGAELGPRIREHLRFGVRGFSSGLASELNTRVDVLILGVYASDAVVGAYSFAAILAEGMYQLLIVLRTSYAPTVIRLWTGDQKQQLTGLVRRVRDRTWLGAAGVGLVAAVGYALVVPHLTSDPALADSWQYFAILLAGMVASAGYAPFQPMLLYGGLPGWHTVFMLAIAMVNAAGNLILVPMHGPIGAAAATAAAFALGVLLLRRMTARLLGLSI
jgi:O-antigen/teichoic acid export membrane protein